MNISLSEALNLLNDWKKTGAILQVRLAKGSLKDKAWAALYASFSEAKSMLSDAPVTGPDALKVNGSSVEIPNATPGVRFYWVFH